VCAFWWYRDFDVQSPNAIKENNRTVSVFKEVTNKSVVIVSLGFYHRAITWYCLPFDS